VQNLVLASADQAWSFGGAIMTFLLPMLAFVAVALWLLVLYTKPQLVPGHRAPGAEVPVGATRVPGEPVEPGLADSAPAVPASGSGEPASVE
jgi:hypothetical protein